MTSLRQIPSFPQYQASSDGTVWRNGRILRSQSNGHGYLRVKLSVEGKTRDGYVHRLVCEAFHGLAPANHECRHLDGVRGNNKPENLCWSTKAENEADKQIHGTSLKGERYCRAVLTDEIVLKARDRAKRGEQVKAIAAEFGVNATTLRDAVMGRKWPHLPGALPAYSTRRKFADDQVREIRSLHPAQGFVELARRYGVTENAIRQIVRRTSYVHVI